MLIAYGLILLAVSMDLKTMRISNRLILVGLGISLVQRFICEGVSGILAWICLISFPVILLYLLFLLGALGAGDIKLFSVIGGFVNFKELVYCIIFAFIFAAIFSLVKMIYFRTFFSSMKNLWGYFQKVRIGEIESYVPNSMEKGRIHFSVAILLGLMVTNLLIS